MSCTHRSHEAVNPASVTLWWNSHFNSQYVEVHSTVLTEGTNTSLLEPLGPQHYLADSYLISGASTSLHPLRMWAFRLGRFPSNWQAGIWDHVDCVVQEEWRAPQCSMCEVRRHVGADDNWRVWSAEICRVACDWVKPSKPPCFRFCDVLLGCCTARST